MPRTFPVKPNYGVEIGVMEPVEISSSNEPARKIRPNYRSSTGFYVTRKGKALAFESKQERDALLTLDFDPSVRDLVTQPLRIGNYVPDCRIETTFDLTVIVEIKSESELVEKWIELSAKYSAANDYCFAKGFEFVFVTDFYIYYSEQYRLNILKKVRFLGARPEESDEQVQEQLVKLLGQMPLSVGSLAKKIEAPLDEANRIREICRLLCSGSAHIFKTPTPHLKDCLISTTEEGCDTFRSHVFSFEQMKERLRTHPYRQLEGGFARLVN